MNIDKEQMLVRFRDALITHDIYFKEHANGHFIMLNPVTQEVICQVWPTTEKMCIQDGPTVTGMEAIVYQLFESEKFPIRMPKIPAIDPLSEEVKTCRKRFEGECSDNAKRSKAQLLIIVERTELGTYRVVTYTDSIGAELDYYFYNYDANFKCTADGVQLQVVDYIYI